MSTRPAETGYRKKAAADTRITKAIEKRLYVLRYNLFDLRKRYAGRWRRSLVLLAVQALLVLMPNLILHPKLGLRSTGLLALAVLASNVFLRLEVNAVQTQKISESKNERKIRTATIIDQLSSRFPSVFMTEMELRELRQRMLLAITSSVASSLGMEPGGFVASLLIKTPTMAVGAEETLMVIARSSDSRDVGLLYPKEGMLAWDAIERGQVQVTGDVTEEYEGFEAKPYRSVISFPILVEGKAIAAVNVDHSFRFLFLERGLLFQTNLRPYLRLVALSLVNITETTTRRT